MTVRVIVSVYQGISDDVSRTEARAYNLAYSIDVMFGRVFIPVRSHNKAYRHPSDCRIIILLSKTICHKMSGTEDKPTLALPAPGEQSTEGNNNEVKQLDVGNGQTIQMDSLGPILGEPLCDARRGARACG